MEGILSELVLCFSMFQGSATFLKNGSGDTIKN